jgi:hypothetical protein
MRPVGSLFPINSAKNKESSFVDIRLVIEYIKMRLKQPIETEI